jgi:hypothetical protein
VISVCEDTHRKLQRSAYARRPISTVKNGVDTDRFPPYPPAAGAGVRCSWPVRTAGRLVIGSNAGRPIQELAAYGASRRPAARALARLRTMGESAGTSH